LDRTPPVGVRRQLRREVGFGCPVEGCSNPYLTYHHFDPPWKEREHHNAEGMIALCAEHHAKADSGAFTREQLGELKRKAVERRSEPQGRFDWLRRELLVVVGGNFYPRAEGVLEVGGRRVIWFSRDTGGHICVNVDLPFVSKSGEPRLLLRDNDWLLQGIPTDFECPPSGRLIHAKYENGDELRVEFFELRDQQDFLRRYPNAEMAALSFSFPLMAVEVSLEIADTPFHFGPTSTQIGPVTLKRSVLDARCAFVWNAPW
jgi:hypothetical protein